MTSVGVGMLCSLSTIILIQVFQPGNVRITITPTMTIIAMLGAIITYLVMYLAIRYMSRIATTLTERIVCTFITALMSVGALLCSNSWILVLMLGQVHSGPLTIAHFFTPHYLLLPQMPAAWVYSVFAILPFLGGAWIASSAENPNTSKAGRIAMYVFAGVLLIGGCGAMPVEHLASLGIQP